MPVTLPDLLPSWELHLRAGHKSPRTIESYLEAAGQLVRYLAEHGGPLSPDGIGQRHVEAFIAGLLAEHKPATAAVRFRSLQQLFRWLEDEGEITESPMRRMRVPRVADQPVPIFTDADVRALLDACAGKGLEDRRDIAIIRLFDATGLRLAELAGLASDDVDLRAGTAAALGKGGKGRLAILDPATIEALDRYLRLRRRHAQAGLPWLWISPKGRLTASGISQMLRRRGRQAGVADVHPHRFRHTFSHNWRAHGGSEDGLMQANGWTTRAMLARYAASTAAARAQAEARRLNLGGRL